MSKVKFTATVEIEICDECVRSRYEIPSAQSVTPAQTEEYVRPNSAGQRESFDGFEIKELKPCL